MKITNVKIDEDSAGGDRDSLKLAGAVRVVMAVVGSCNSGLKYADDEE